MLFVVLIIIRLLQTTSLFVLDYDPHAVVVFLVEKQTRSFLYDWLHPHTVPCIFLSLIARRRAPGARGHGLPQHRLQQPTAVGRALSARGIARSLDRSIDRVPRRCDAAAARTDDDCRPNPSRTNNTAKGTTATRRCVRCLLGRCALSIDDAARTDRRPSRRVRIGGLNNETTVTVVAGAAAALSCSAPASGACGSS